MDLAVTMPQIFKRFYSSLGCPCKSMRLETVVVALASVPRRGPVNRAQLLGGRSAMASSLPDSQRFTLSARNPRFPPLASPPAPPRFCVPRRRSTSVRVSGNDASLTPGHWSWGCLEFDQDEVPPGSVGTVPARSNALCMTTCS